jgi:predicted DNA-binding transcriptional regulator AlpA
MTGLSESTIRRKEKTGQFPIHERLGPNAIAWRESELIQVDGKPPRVPLGKMR